MYKYVQVCTHKAGFTDVNLHEEFYICNFMQHKFQQK